MQQVFDDYILHLTKVYSTVLEEVGMLSKLMADRWNSKNTIPLKQVVALDGEIPRLIQEYPQFAYMTEHIFKTEDMFDSVKRTMAFSPELFPQYERGKNILTPVLLSELSHVSKEKDSTFILNYLKQEKIKEFCWGKCFSNIYKNHFALRLKAVDMFYAFLESCETLKFQCGEDVISVFDGTNVCAQDIIKLLQKIYEKSNPNYNFYAEKKALDSVHFFHHCPLKDIPKESVFIRMLYHTRYLNATEFSTAFSSMGISKMLEYDFGLAQRILPRLFSKTTNLPYGEALDIIRGQKDVPFFKNYLENEQWLASSALALAEVFGVKYETYLNKVLPYISIRDAASFIKDIDYGNPKNKLLGEFLLNNAVYQKTDRFYCAHDLTELEKICRAWKNMPMKEIKADRYRKILSLCETYCFKEIRSIPFSKEAMYWRMSEKDYIDAESAYIQGQNIPDAFDTKAVWKSGEYIGHFLPRSDVRVGFFGHYTGCCQHYTGTGATAAIACVKDPFSQLFVIEKSGRIIAGSFVWQTDMNDYKGVCFDSVEVLSSYEKRKEIFSIYQSVCDALVKDYQKITFGKNPFDLSTRVRPLPIPKDIYTDARAQFSFKHLSMEMD